MPIDPEEHLQDAVGLGYDNCYIKSQRDGVWVGIYEYHKAPNGNWCDGGWIPFDVPENSYVPPEKRWTVVSYDPLHLEPSLLCMACGSHGFIREGKWVPC